MVITTTNHSEIVIMNQVNNLGSPTIDLGEIQETSTEIFKGSGSGYTEVW